MTQYSVQCMPVMRNCIRRSTLSLPLHVVLVSIINRIVNERSSMSTVAAKLATVTDLKNKLLIATTAEEEHLDVEKCLDLLRALEEELITGKSSAVSKMRLVQVLGESGVGKALTKSLKSFRRFRRSAISEAGSDKKNSSGTRVTSVVERCNQLLADLKVKVDEESKGQKKSITEKISDGSMSTQISMEISFPSSVQEYRMRLTKQKKEMYKDPPVLPERVTIDPVKQKLPKRSKGFLLFEEKYKDFRPNLSPEEILRAGAFGGTYFRSIVSSVTNKSYRSDQVLKDTLIDDWYAGLDKRVMLTSAAYHNAVNKYNVKCGGSLGMWESSGWISEVDPYGWFQWYCRFYQGRRCSDDERQVKRWMKSAGEKGRFKSQLCNKCLAANKTADDASISPVIRQTLLHWGFTLTSEILAKHARNRR